MAIKTLKIAVQGCCHGELDLIYSKLIGKKVDLLVITGDFQALRNNTDLNAIAVPSKYKSLGHFHKYYSGQKRAPIPTIFIGGNHESSSYLTELKYGGWVAPNIYYLGEFGCLWYKGLRIVGASGIFNYSSFLDNRIEDVPLPYTPSTIRSVYHMTPMNYLKMMLIQSELNIDIVVSHDWPQYIYHQGGLDGLLKKKPFFKDDINSGRLGSPLLKNVFNHLRPTYWFSSHLHVKFEVDVPGHQQLQKTKNTDEIDLDMGMDDTEEEEESSSSSTHFLALDKCGKHRRHLEIFNVSVDKNHISFDKDDFYYDRRAIVINKLMGRFVVSDKGKQIKPKELLDSSYTIKVLRVLNQEIEEELNSLSVNPEDFKVPFNFKVIAPSGLISPDLQFWPNNQTEEYCTKFDISR
ncbi:Metallophos-domain-containing protein [Yamadazyma tenuis ATCC 10573]|uniref:Metallophos-domain-containing protein n=1 Tax=Candida tenuis (strain ATCC 10573 / BCRC 21748 / CBS 615 / JCM 9827 / NBRC 10315 / NRRL Y-1498 / VKM Y-70) TaxID=590646 RepID=G3B4T2_CANTC|nr:Metallophos-domain-containing protein [Yamadazyma tenuis ATCC 10573]EGV63866.1 Metallophos-domain-containing protein [Yamadazyma tenuis ATCC 10573]